jgi:hypothetical protein
MSGGRDEIHVPFSSGAAMIDAEISTKRHRKQTQLKDDEPGVLERRSNEPKTSCGGADMIVVVRIREKGYDHWDMAELRYRRKADCCNLYETRLEFPDPRPGLVFNLADLSFLFGINPTGTLSHDLLPAGVHRRI